MSSRQVSSMTEDEMIAVIRTAVRAEFSAAGLRVDDAEDQDQSREDFRFLRRLRNRVDKVSSAVGMAIILAIITGLIAFTWSGFTSSIK